MKLKVKWTAAIGVLVVSLFAALDSPGAASKGPEYPCTWCFGEGDCNSGYIEGQHGCLGCTNSGCAVV